MKCLYDAVDDARLLLTNWPFGLITDKTTSTLVTTFQTSRLRLEHLERLERLREMQLFGQAL